MFDKLALQMDIQAKTLDKMQTEITAQLTKKTAQGASLQNAFTTFCEEIESLLLQNNAPQPQSQQQDMPQSFTNNMIPPYQGYNLSSLPMPTYTPQVPHPSMQGNHTQYQPVQGHGLQPQEIQPNTTGDAYMHGGPGHDMRRDRSLSSSPTNTHHPYQGLPGTQSPMPLSQPLSQNSPHPTGNPPGETN